MPNRHAIILNLGGTLKHSSKWMNGITITLEDTSLLSAFRQKSFVKKVELTLVPTSYSASNKLSKTSILTSYSTYGMASAQIDIHNGRQLHSAGFRGKGIAIAVLDGGFYKSDEIPVFDSLRVQGRLLGTRDFAENSTSFFSVTNWHGTSVLSTMDERIFITIRQSRQHARIWNPRRVCTPQQQQNKLVHFYAGGH